MAKKEEPSILDLAHALLDPKQAIKKKPRTFGTGNFKKKIHCTKLAVHPDQVKEIAAEDKKRGVSVPYNEHGQPIFDNSSHFRRYCKAYGYRHYGYV